MPITTFGNNTGDVQGTDVTFVKSETPTTNYNTETYVEMFNWSLSGDDIGYTLVRFTSLVGIIPVGSTINSVKLRLRGYFSFGSDSIYLVSVYLSYRPWVASQVTWDVYSTGNSWTNPGGWGVGDSVYRPDRSSLQYPADIVDGTWYEWPSSARFISDVQDAINAGVNPSWLLVSEADPGPKTRQFYSDAAADGYRPQLVVDWTPPVSTRRKVSLAMM